MENKTFAFIKSDKKLIKIFHNDITMIRGLGNYVEIYTLLNKKFIYYKSLKQLIISLPDEFMRIHNSTIVNLTNIDSFEDNHIIMQDKKITVAKSCRNCLGNKIDSYML